MAGRRLDGDRMLVIDTSTRQALVAVGDAGSGHATVRATVRATSRREAGHRHGSQLLEQIEEALAAAGLDLAALTAIGVGTGPGSFTGLRVGLATAKTLAYARALPLVGVASVEALARATREGAPGAPDIAVVLPAGAHDHFVARAGADPQLVPPGGLAAAVEGAAAVAAIDLPPDLLGEGATRLGRVAMEGMPLALLILVAERLAVGPADDPATLVPRYVALPRGIAARAAETRWSPDLH